MLLCMKNIQVVNYRHLDEPLDEGKSVFEYTLARIAKPLPRVGDLFHVPRHSGLSSAFIIFFLLQNEVTCTERLNSWYCTKLEQPRVN